MSQIKNECLLLNSDYTPITIVNWQKSIVWYLRSQTQKQYGIEILSFYEDQYILSSNGKKYLVPSVARSIKYFNNFNRDVNFSRKNLFLRDNYTCQYCGNVFSINQLTYDHVIPKSRYIVSKHRSTNWTNIVTACIKCNARKGNKTPEEAGMLLINKPYKPKYCNKYLHNRCVALTIGCRTSQNQWKPYLNIK